MGIIKFEIEVLQRSILRYFPGETMEGILHVVTEQEIKTEGISMNFEGKAKVQWSERTGQNSITYWGEELFLNEKVYLFGTGDLAVILHGGMHQFPFRFTLPMKIPSSYEDVVGQVTYEMKAEMQRSWLRTHKTKVSFEVTGILDLNIEPGAAQSIEANDSKNLCCLSCKSGPIGFTLTMPRTGYVPGEYIKFNSEFSNQSNRRVKGVTASLVQKIQYQAKSRKKFEVLSICSVPGPSVEPGDSENWSGNMFQIPPLVPTGLASCQIIDVQYYLKIEMDLAGPSINLTKEIPIIIGNIPFRNLNQGMTEFQPTPSLPITSPFSVLPPTSYSAIPPMYAGTSTQFQPSKYEVEKDNQGFTYSSSVPINTGLVPSAPSESFFTVSSSRNYN